MRFCWLSDSLCLTGSIQPEDSKCLICQKRKTKEFLDNEIPIWRQFVNEHRFPCPTHLQLQVSHICLYHDLILVNRAAGGPGSAAAPRATGAQQHEIVRKLRNWHYEEPGLNKVLHHSQLWIQCFSFSWACCRGGHVYSCIKQKIKRFWIWVYREPYIYCVHFLYLFTQWAILISNVRVHENEHELFYIDFSFSFLIKNWLQTNYHYFFFSLWNINPWKFWMWHKICPMIDYKFSQFCLFVWQFPEP